MFRIHKKWVVIICVCTNLYSDVVTHAYVLICARTLWRMRTYYSVLGRCDACVRTNLCSDVVTHAYALFCARTLWRIFSKVSYIMFNFGDTYLGEVKGQCDILYRYTHIYIEQANSTEPVCLSYMELNVPIRLYLPL